MPASVGDLIRITDFQRLLGQQVLNVYFYRVSDTTPMIGDYLGVFSSSWQTIVLPFVVQLQHVELVHESIYLENLTNGIDIKSDAAGFPVPGGLAAGDVMPPFVSYGFQLLRESRVTRPGYKRIGGVPESEVTDGVYSGNPASLTDLETALGQDFTAGIVTYAAPVIPKRPFAVPTGVYLYSDVSAGLYKGVGTQNTRKFGRGA